MKRLIMPLTAFLMVGTVLFSGCNNKEEVPGEEPAVVDTLTPPANVDTLVVDTAGTGTEVKVVDSDSANKAGKGGKTQGKKDPIKTEEGGNTGTRRPQRDDKSSTSTPTPSTQEPTKSSDPGNTTTRRPQRP